MSRTKQLINQMIGAAYPHAQAVCNLRHPGTVAVLSGYVHPVVHLVLTCHT